MCCLWLQDGNADEEESGGPSGEGEEGGEKSEEAGEGETEEGGEGETLSDADSEEDEEAGIQNVVLAQFDKVTRSKNRWKCTLKDGVMHMDGRDYLFSTAFGEMQF